jgi:hypothetical protein
MAFIELHPVAGSHRAVTINADQIQKIDYFGRWTLLRLAGGQSQYVIERKNEIEAILRR